MMETMRRALEVPHMTFCDDVGADRLSLLRSDLKEAAERRGVKLSYLPLIVKVNGLQYDCTKHSTIDKNADRQKRCRGLTRV